VKNVVEQCILNIIKDFTVTNIAFQILLVEKKVPYDSPLMDFYHFGIYPAFFGASPQSFKRY